MRIVYNVIVDSGHFSDTIGTFETFVQADCAGKDWLAEAVMCFLDSLDDEEKQEINERCLEGDKLEEVLAADYGFDCSYEVMEEEESDEQIIEQFVSRVVEQINLPSQLHDGTLFKELRAEELDNQPTVGEIVNAVCTGLKRELIGYLDTVANDLSAPFCDEVEAVFEAIKDEEEFYRVNKKL